MAEGLGDIASLLGQSMSQAAQTGQGEDRKARKKAMKDQLLMSLAAPIVTGLGKGVVDFAGDVVLGSASKDFFATGEGAAFNRRRNDFKRPVKYLTDQEEFLIKNSDGGFMPGTVAGGILNLDFKERLARQKRNFGHLDSYKVLEGATVFDPTEEDIASAEEQANELRNYIEDFSRGPADAELLARYKQTDIGKGRGRKIASKAATFLKGGNWEEDVVAPSLDLMLTGGDSSLRDTDFYRLMTTNKDFKNELRKKVEQARDVGLGTAVTLDNQFEELLARTPEIGKLIQSEYHTKREMAIDTSKLLDQARTEPDIERVIAQLTKQGQRVTTSSVSALLLDEIEGIDAEKNASQFMLNSDFDEQVRAIQNSLSQIKHGRPYETTDGKEGLVNSKNREAINTATESYIAQVGEMFNSDLYSVISELKEKGTYGLNSNILSAAGKRKIANIYMATALDPNGPHLTSTSREVPSISWVASIGQPKLDLMNGTIDSKGESLRDIIRSAFEDPEVAKEIEKKALEDGTAFRVSRESTTTTGLYNPSIRTTKNSNGQTVEDRLEDITTDLTLNNFEKKSDIQLFIQTLEETIRKRAGSRELAPIVLQDFEYFRKKYKID